MPGGFDACVDVLVIGAGGCGLVAAIVASDLGCDVAVVEKQNRLLGNTLLSSGSIPGAGTRFQRALGIVDAPATFEADLRACSGPHDAMHLVGRLAALSAGLVEWLVDVAKVELTLIDTYRHVGHSVNRLHAPPDRRGETLITALYRAASLRDIPIAFGNPARDLVVEAGRVVGAVTENAQGTRARIGARSVILAVNGFGGAPVLLRQHCPAAAAAGYSGSTGSEGEAILWGEAVGAAFGNLGAYQAHASLAYPHGTLVTWTVMEKGGLIVGGDGRRFGDEMLGYSAFADLEFERHGPFFAIYDDRIAEAVGTRQPEFAELDAIGGFVAADDARELAGLISVDPAALEQTVADAAQAAAGGAPDRFGRRDWGLGPLAGRLRATRVVPAILHTQGGVMVDDDARVLRPDGGIVPGLYAGGGAAAGISGPAGSGGYASGNGLLSALGLGYVAGHAAARESASAALDNTVPSNKINVYAGEER